MATPSSSPASEPSGPDPFLLVWSRRAFTISVALLSLTFVLGTAPLWIPLAALYDFAHGGRRSALACFLFLTWYLLCEAWGIGASFAAWVRHGRNPQAFLRRNFELECKWAGALFAGAERTLCCS